VSRRRVVVAGALVVLAGAGAAAWLHWGRADTSTPTARRTLPTVAVQRGTLTATTSVNGNLGFAGSYQVNGYRGGTVTWTPAVGATISRGEHAYAVDQRPVPLLYGNLPFYRNLAVGATGDDVKELEQNLSALGYTGFTVDTTYTAGTADAVKHWQDDLGVTETGTLAAGDAVTAPGQIRVTELSAQVGGRANPAQAVFTATSTNRVVHVDLDVVKQSYAKAGEQVSVALPNGRKVTGTISAVGTVAQQAAANDSGGTNGANARQNGGNGGGSSGAYTIGVDVTLTGDLSGLTGLDQAPVTVALVSDTRRDVLSVPVQALMAMADGSYAVKVADATGRHLVKVETGLFTSGRVEIRGTGIEAGTKVEVPTL
jgi:peptidoglycan hydrolase-like protein with peptidoglycan-binding domain